MVHGLIVGFTNPDDLLDDGISLRESTGSSEKTKQPQAYKFFLHFDFI
jgi:hypothetical protein